MSEINQYLAMAIQPEVRAHYVTGKTAKEQRRENLKHHCELIDRFVMGAEHRSGGMMPRLVVFPESFIHGFGPARSRDFRISMEMAIEIPGEETAILGKKCQEYDFYLVGSAYEYDPAFPNHFFNCGFIIDPKGEVILKYRKINTTNNDIELSTSPHDLLEVYGNDPTKLFPVVETPIGNLGVYICYDGTFPEVARALALNGAEVLCRPNMWFFGTTEHVELMTMHNRLRAFENVAWLVTSNWARSPLSEYESSCGHAMIVDYQGRIITQRTDNNESFVCTPIDLRASREYRRNAKFGNFLMQLRTEVYAAAYANRTCWPPNLYLDKNQQTLDEKWGIYDEIIGRLVDDGVLK